MPMADVYSAAEMLQYTPKRDSYGRRTHLVPTSAITASMAGRLPQTGDGLSSSLPGGHAFDIRQSAVDTGEDPLCPPAPSRHRWQEEMAQTGDGHTQRHADLPMPRPASAAVAFSISPCSASVVQVSRAASFGSSSGLAGLAATLRRRFLAATSSDGFVLFEQGSGSGRPVQQGASVRPAGLLTALRAGPHCGSRSSGVPCAIPDGSLNRIQNLACGGCSTMPSVLKGGDLLMASD